MLDRRITFVEGEVARVDPVERHVTVTRGEFSGLVNYDWLVFALGRRLATEQVPGFFEYSHHLLNAAATLKFREALRTFERGHIVLGYCVEARLPVPLFETAFALSRWNENREPGKRATITIVSNETPAAMFGDQALGKKLSEAMKSRGIEFVTDFSIARMTADSIVAGDGRWLNYDLAALIPPFRGPAALLGTETTDAAGYVLVDKTMRATGIDRMYAVGDCVSFPGPKLGHMAVRQAEVAADNLAAEVSGSARRSIYEHEMKLVLETDGKDSIYLHRDLWTDDPATLKQGRFWAWAKRGQEQYWMARHG
jgi:sulfide:quinone oxidoreductase